MAFAEEVVSRDGLTVRFDASPTCERRMRLAADGRSATVNVSRLTDDNPDEKTLEARKRAMADRAFRLLACATDALRGDAKDRPTMGWSSWNSFGVNISEDIILSVARAMATNGLKAAGYRYVNIDDGFFWGHGPDGRLQLHPRRFPNGMKPVVDGIHALGLKAGIYSDAGADTCGSFGGDTCGLGGGLYGHDKADCEMHFNEFGFDFIKVDFCGGGRLALDERARYTEIADAIRATGRKDVRLNICRWAFPGTWAAQVAGSWRTTGDIRARWDSIKYIVRENLYLGPYMSLGHYNDMDMLEVGQVKGAFKSCFEKSELGLTAEEETAHFGLWCLFSSPLLIGCDVRKMPAESIALATNPYLLAMNQNDLGVGPSVVWREGGACVFAKDAESRFGTARFVALYNPDDQERTFKVPLDAVELSGKVSVVDLVERADIGEVEKSFAMTVPPHAARFYRFDGERRLVPTHYEAEAAYLTDFQMLADPKVAGTAYVAACPEASGGATVTNLGMRASNDLVWRDVRIAEEGDYFLDLRVRTPSKRWLVAFVDGGMPLEREIESTRGAFETVPFKVHLKPGLHVVRLAFIWGWMPEIDCLDVRSVLNETPDVSSWHGADMLGLSDANPQKTDKRISGKFEERDFRMFKDKGLNFARLPMDYRHFFETDDGANFNLGGFKKVDEAVTWGRTYGVHVQLCLRRAPDCAVRIWCEFARRYRGIPNAELSFNLIDDSTDGADVLERTAAAIRKVDPGRFIVLDKSQTVDSSRLAAPLRIAAFVCSRTSANSQEGLLVANPK